LRKTFFNLKQMMTDKENWQDKPDEGAFSARRDGEKNSGNSDIDPNQWRKSDDNRETRGNSFEKPRRSSSENSAGGYNRGGNSYNKPRRSFGDNSDRPHRSFGDNSDRPRRPFGEGGNTFNSSREGNNFDRPRRNFGEGDSERPRRPFNESANRFGNSSREGNNVDRLRRNFGEGDSDRPRRPYNEDGNRFNNNNREGNSYDRPRRNFGEGDSERPRRPFNDGGSRFCSGNREGNSFDRPRRNFGEGDSERPRRPFGESGNRFGSGSRDGNYGRPRPSFSGPTLPRPDRADGKPRRPRIKRETSFDHGTPYGNPVAPKYQTNLDPDTPIRLNKFLANAGICSRREADEFIQAGVVRVNGEIVTELGVKVKITDKILFHDQSVSIEHKVYILLNKPKDCVVTSDDPQERLTVLDLIKGACSERVYPVGRLDRNTTGVLLLTNDGDLASKLTHPKFEKRKIYQVTLDKDITEADMQTIIAGVKLEDCEVKADNLSYVDPSDKTILGIEIHSGQNRVVRRIFESLGYKVHKLDRVYFAGLTKKNLPRGKWRYLSEKEVSLLKMGAFV
jgi:23S rRNA pseudouridine2605 synthase